MTIQHDESPILAHQQMIASCTGAVAVSVFTTPFDVVKVRLQAQLKPNAKCYIISNGLMDHICYCGFPPAYNAPITCLLHGKVHTVKFTSTIDAFNKIIEYEGLSKLWRGLPPTMLMAVPATVIYFTGYDQLKVKFGLVEGQSNLFAPMMAGMIARGFAVTSISPIEMVRTKLQSREGYQYRELMSIVKNAVKGEGVLSLWRGIGPTLLRDIPFSALYWTAYEYVKAQQHEHTFLTSFVTGAGAGMLAAVLTTPFDVVKTHRQMELGEINFGEQSKKLPFTFSLIFKLCNEQGIRSLFTGLVARIAKVTPACAIMISTYEYGKKYFQQHNSSKRYSIENY